MTSATTPRPAVPRYFTPADQGTVVCIAPGPSLTYHDLRIVYNAAPGAIYTVTVNDAYRAFPAANVRFSPDGIWWARHADACDPQRYAGRCYTLEHGGPDNVPRLDYYSGTEVLSDDPEILASGGHGGYAAVNLAYHLGPTTIVLLGYDMQPHPTTGVHHFGGDEPDQRHPRYEMWIPRYRALRDALADRNVALWNASQQTAIPESDVPRRHIDDLF